MTACGLGAPLAGAFHQHSRFESLSTASFCLAADAKKKKKISKAETYKIYIYKVLKQVHPDTGGSQTSHRDL